MPASCTVTPGATLTDTTNVTHTLLNSLANPQVQVPDGAIGGAQLNVASVATTMGDKAAAVNYFLNPNLSEPRWARGATAVSCPAGTQTYRADEWWVTPAGAAVSYERVQAGPDHLSLHSAQLTGASSVTTVDFGQDIQAHLASVLCTDIVVSAMIYNNTGSPLAPLLRIDTPATLNDFTAVTNRQSTASATSGAVAQWTRHTWILNAASLTNLHLGARVYLRFPSGSLDTGSKTVRIAQLQIERGTARGPFAPPVDVATTSSSLSGASVSENFFDNPDFSSVRFLQPGVEVVCTSDADTYNAEGWWLNEDGAGSAMRYLRSGTTPNVLSRSSVEIKGGSGSGTVRFGQNRETHVAAACRRQMVFAIQFYNGTGATITPTLKIDTCSSANDFASVSTQVTQTMDAVPDGTWVRQTATFDGSTISNFANGFRIYVEIAAGVMTTSGDVVRFAQAQLQPGTAPTAWNPPSPERSTYGQLTPAVALDGFRSDGAEVTYTAAEVTVQDPAGRIRRLANLSVIIDGDTVGANGRDAGTLANGWWYVWVIASENAYAGIVSLSRTAPTLPAGYNYKGLIGAVYVTSGVMRIYRQRGKRVEMNGLQVFSGTLSTSYAEITIDNIVPPTAVRIFGFIGTLHASIDLIVTYHPEDGGIGGETILMAENTGTAGPSSLYATVPFSLPLTQEQKFDIQAASATPAYLMRINGFEFE